MAIQGLNVTPMTGEGNATVYVSASENTGRRVKIQTLTWTGIGVTGDIKREVIQEGIPEFVNASNSTIMVMHNDKTVQLRGFSNSSKLTFEVDTQEFPVTIQESYSAGGKTTINGKEIEGDPGMEGAYHYAMFVVLPTENTSTKQLSTKIIVRGDEGKYTTHTIVMDPAPRYLEVTPEIINLNAKGDTVSVAVKSNTAWTIK